VNQKNTFLATALAAALIAGCAPKEEGEAPGGTASTSQKQFLSIGTAPPGGAFFVVGGALTEVLNENRGPNGWRITAEATKGTQENIRRLTRGELDFAVANAAITYFATRGEEGWDQKHDVQGVMTLAPNVALFLTPKSSGLTRISDLRGKRVVIGPAGAGFEFFVKPILGAHGMTFADFTPLNASQSSAVDMLADGSADAVFVGGAVPTASITQAATSQDILFIPFDPAAIDELVADYPFFEKITVPAGTYKGMEGDFPTLNVGSMHLITAANQDEELVYQVTKTLWENRAKVVEKHAAGKAINPKIVIKDPGTPFHPGAIRFYREIGIWPGN
jgi:hypothetical protein